MVAEDVSECPFCGGGGSVWDAVVEIMIPCPTCRGMGIMEIWPEAERKADA